MTDPDHELIELLQTKAPEELTGEEISRLRAALVYSASLRQALAERLEMERYLNAALGAPSLSADHIIAHANRFPSPAGSGAFSLLKWAMCLLLAIFVASVLIVAVVLPPNPDDTGKAKLVAKAEGAADGRPSDEAANIAKPPAAEAVVGGTPPVAAPAKEKPAAVPADSKPAEGKTAAPATEKPGAPGPTETRPEVVVEAGPWPNPAVLAAQPVPGGAEALDDFNARTLAPTAVELRQWFDKVPNRPSTMDNTKGRNGAGGLIDGLLRLRSPWAPQVALRITAQENYKLQIHLWHGDRGLTLHYYENFHRVWIAYQTTRKPGSPVPDTWQMVGHDEGRNALVNPADPSTYDLNCDGKQFTLSRGTVRLLTVPFEGMPGEVYFEGKAILLQLQLVRAVELPAERTPGPVIIDIQKPANENWLVDQNGGAQVIKLPDGSIEFKADKIGKACLIALPLACDRLQEIVLQLDDPQPGTGIFWGDQQGKPRGALGFFRDKRTRGMVVQLGQPTGGNPEIQVDAAHSPVPFCAPNPWIKLLTGAGSMRAWLSADGVHWARFLDPWMNQQGALASIGLYSFPDKLQSRSIRLKSVVSRELPAINALATAELRRKIPEFAAPSTLGAWLQAVYGSQPADVDTAAWRMACAVQALAANSANAPTRALIFDKLLEDVVALDKPWQERLQILQEAALICPCWDDAALAQHYGMHYIQLGNLLARDEHPEALVNVARAQLSAPLWTRNPVQLPEDASREQILRLAYGHHWPELYDLCNQLRFNRRNLARPPGLMDWAEALAAQQAPQHAAAGTALLRSDWRHPLVAELSKEAYNLLAELEAALEGKSYRDACQIISTAGNQAGPGVLPDSRDPDLLVSLTGAVNQALREHPPLRTTMNEQFGPIGRLRIRQAIADDDAAAIEAGTVQFAGTEAAAEAQVWLADRAQSTGAFAQALGHYREALRWAAPSLRRRAVAGAQLAAAMMGQTFADEAVGPAEFGEVQLGTAEFSQMLNEMRTRRSTENTMSLASIAKPPGTAPLPAGFDLKIRGRWVGDVGEGPDKVPGEEQQFQVDWVARQAAAVMAGDRLILSNRFQVSCFNVQSGKFDWRTMLGADSAATHDWPLMPMRPLVTAGRIFVRRLPKQGPNLVCLDTASGKLLWTSKADSTKFVVSDPLLIQDELFALIVTRAEQELLLSLCTYDPASGAVLSESPLVRLREHWWQQRTCQVLALDDTFIVACGGSVFRADLMGRIRWLRKETWAPPSVNRNWVVQEQAAPIESAGKIFVTQPGVLDVACLEAETGRLLWRQPVPDLRRVVGMADGRVLVQTDAGITAFDAASGKLLWEQPATGLLEARLFGGNGGLLLTRSLPLGDEKLFGVWLTWLDPATGQMTATWPLDTLRHERPRLGPLVTSGERLWTFFGRGEKEPHRDIIELTPNGTAALPGAPNHSPSDLRWPSVNPALVAAAAEVLPQWTVLSGTVNKQHPLRLNEWREEHNVFQNPTAAGQALRLARRVKFPADKPARLRLRVSSDVPWRLDVEAGGKQVLSETVEPVLGGGWKDVDVDLSSLAGQTTWLMIRQQDEAGKQALVKWKSAKLQAD